MNNPLVSIIVPVYNVGPYIERCLKSVINQTYTGSLECLIIDDCGTDDSIIIARRLISEYKGPIKFQLLQHDHNRGLSAARNTGTDAATGDYIFYLDSDDELPHNSIEKLLRPIQDNPRIEIVVGNYLRFSPESPLSPAKWRELDKEDEYVTNKDVRDLFYNKNAYPISAWNKLIKKDFLLSNHLYFKEGLLHEDWLWTHHVLKHLSCLHILPDITYLYYKRPQSITMGTSKDVRAYNLGIVYEEIATHFTHGEEARETMHYLYLFCILLCNNHQMASYQRASRLFKQALADGHHTKDWLLLTMVIFLSKSFIGRILFSTALKVKRIPSLIVNDIKKLI